MDRLRILIKKSLFGSCLAGIYLIIGVYVYWDMLFGECGGGCFFGPDFGMFVFTLPGSILIDISPLYQDAIIYPLYALLILLNTILLYWCGRGIGALLRKIFGGSK